MVWLHCRAKISWLLKFHSHGHFSSSSALPSLYVNLPDISDELESFVAKGSAARTPLGGGRTVVASKVKMMSAKAQRAPAAWAK
jgi:hypothetical protein